MRDRINLLPREHLKSPEVPFNLVFAAVFGTFALILALAFFFQDRSYRRLKGEKADLHARIGALSGRSSKFKEYTDTMAAIQEEEEALHGQLQRVRSFQDERFYFSDVLREISFIVPDGLWLTELKTGKEESEAIRSFVITGRARYNHAVAGFILALERSRFFKNIFLNFSKESASAGESLQEFEITADLKR